VQRAIAATLLALLVVPPPSVPAAPDFYGQFSGGPSMTGVLDTHGPRTNDSAFTVQLPGSRSVYASPLIIDRHTYVLTQRLSTKGYHYDEERGLTETGVWRISLDEPEREAELIWRLQPGTPFAGLPNGLGAGLLPPPGLASDGRLLYAVDARGVVAANLDGTDERLVWPFDIYVADHDGTACADPALDDSILYLACIQMGRSPNGAAANDVVLFAAAIDVAAGARKWIQFKDTISGAETMTHETIDSLPTAPPTTPPDLPNPPPCNERPAPTCLTRKMHVPVASARIGSIVSFITFAAYNVPPSPDDEARDVPSASSEAPRLVPDPHFLHYLILDAETGAPLWTYFHDNPELRDPSNRDWSASCKMTGTDEYLVVRDDGLHRLDPRTGHRNAFAISVQNSDLLDVENCAGFAFDGKYIYSSWGPVLERFDMSAGALVQRYEPAGSDVEEQTWSVSPFLLADDVLYGRMTRRAENPWIATENWFHALDTKTGEFLWSKDFVLPFRTAYPRSFEMGVAGGVVVVAGYDGSVTVIGTTAASPKVVAGAPQAYPTLGDMGRFGAPTMFRADWGDGTSTDWQTSPILNHTFDRSLEAGAKIRLQVRNDAGQEASLFFTVFPGVPAPAGPSLFARAFSDEGLPFTLSGFALLLIAAAVIAFALVGRRIRAQGARLEQVNRLLSARDAQRYHLVRELGRGTFGVAHLAKDTRLDRLVVLKQPRAAWALGPEGMEAFLQEARTAAQVHHPNVVTVLEILPESDPPVLVMEYVSGGSLADRLGRPMSARDAARIVAEVLDGLAAIHRAGIVHRDLKPANILLEESGHAKVSDFGLAGPPTPAMDDTPTWGSLTPGSLAYMSPEQVRGESVGTASDLYAVGVLLHELVAGRRPYNAAAAEPLRQAIANGKTRLDREVPTALRSLLERLLDPDPKKRPSAQEAAEHLRRLRK
jgi:hypothetical protein